MQNIKISYFQRWTKNAKMAESEIMNLLQIYMVASKTFAISWNFTCEMCRLWSFKIFYQKLKKVTRRRDVIRALDQIAFTFIFRKLFDFGKSGNQQQHVKYRLIFRRTRLAMYDTSPPQCIPNIAFSESPKILATCRCYLQINENA